MKYKALRPIVGVTFANEDVDFIVNVGCNSEKNIFVVQSMKFQLYLFCKTLEQVNCVIKHKTDFDSFINYWMLQERSNFTLISDSF